MLAALALLWSQLALAQLPPGNGIVINQTPVQGGSNGQCLFINNAQISSQACGSGSGTVTSVSVTTANGISGSVATATTTPAISLTLGAITPSTAAIGAGSAITSSGPGGAMTSTAYTANATANTPSTVVARDGSGNFSAGTITAALSGNATSATTATSATSAGTVTTNANMTGDVTSVGNATTYNNILPSGKLAYNGAVLQSVVAGPAGTTSAAGVMMGLGVTTCRFTPTFSTRVKFQIDGSVNNSAVNGLSTFGLRFGTGAGPANGVAPTGTALANSLTITSATGSASSGFALSVNATGLSAGTTYWFDTTLAASTGTSSISSPNCSASEF
jgi:hypothetical protein